MKTVQEWAQELPEDVREKFLANVVKQRGKIFLKWEYHRLSGAISLAFGWPNSIGGYDFWNNIYKQLKSENR